MFQAELAAVLATDEQAIALLKEGYINMPTGEPAPPPLPPVHSKKKISKKNKRENLLARRVLNARPEAMEEGLLSR